MPAAREESPGGATTNPWTFSAAAGKSTIALHDRPGIATGGVRGGGERGMDVVRVSVFVERVGNCAARWDHVITCFIYTLTRVRRVCTSLRQKA